MRACKFCLCFAVLVLSCSEPEDDATPIADRISCDTMSVVFELGEMMGDSQYVFGEITSAEPVSGGVAVLDIHSCRISFFNGQGEFIRSVGGHGEGPGEFLLPIDFAVLDDGRIAVADLVGRRIDILSAEGELLNTLSTGQQILPYRMDAVSDSSFFVYYYSTMPFGDRTNMGFQVELWNTAGLIGEIWSYREDYDGAGFSFAPGYVQCCASEGSIYLSRMNDSEFRIFRYSDTLEESPFIAEEGVSIPSDTTDTGYDEPYAYVSFTTGGSFVELESEPLEFRPQIGVLGFDGDGRLWVRRGTVDSEEWLVYSSEGQLLGEGTIAGIAENGRLRYAINKHGAVAWAPYTEEYPVLYVLGVPSE